jgi:hypothetical protein
MIRVPPSLHQNNGYLHHWSDIGHKTSRNIAFLQKNEANVVTHSCMSTYVATRWCQVRTIHVHTSTYSAGSYICTYHSYVHTNRCIRRLIQIWKDPIQHPPQTSKSRLGYRQTTSTGTSSLEARSYRYQAGYSAMGDGRWAMGVKDTTTTTTSVADRCRKPQSSVLKRKNTVLT